MTPERYQQVGQLYHAALELDPDKRPAFLAQTCGGDEELRREVASLLDAHEKAGPYFAAPALEVAAGLPDHQGNASLIGQSLSGYHVISWIGAGGMGEVYLAEDMDLGRKTALKVLPADFTQDPQRVFRFEREARAASALNHPNIVTIFQVGRLRGRHFMATEYIDGETLRTRLEAGRLELKEALDVAIQIADALNAAHEAGIVHRDIKPENVMLRRDGLVKVLDFGLAKLIEARGDDDLTSTAATEIGVVLGTPRYMSPEQARGEGVDGRSDIFSLGMVIYEMLACRPPFEGATRADVVAAILEREPPSLMRLAPGVPAELERIVGRALAKRRDERYPSVKDLLVDLRNLRLETDVSARLNAASLTAEFIRNNKTGIVAAGLTAVLLTALVAVGILNPSGQSPITEGEINSLAVLPLDNLSGDSGQEYFTDGMTEAMITELGKIGALRVISRHSVMIYKGARTPLTRIAGDLKVDALVVGSVLRSGDRVRVTTQLIEAATERQRWSESYERDGRDVLDLQSEVARAIAREIRARVTPAEQARLTHSRPVHRKAYDEYLQGRYLLWSQRTEEVLSRAVDHFESAIKADPGFALAYAGLADCYNLLGTVAVAAMPPMEARRRAEEAAGKALELDDGLAEARVALGHVNFYSWNWTAAEEHFKRAIELNPNYASGRIVYAHYLAAMNRAGEAVAEANRAQDLDPHSLTISAQRGFILENARRLDEAIDQLRRVTAVDPDNYVAHWILGHTYAANGQLEEAIATSERAAALSNRTPGALGFLGMAYGLAGRRDEANRVLNELLERDRRDYVTPVAVANVHIGLGNKDQAFAWLEKAYQERTYYMAYLKVFPLVDPLRSDPRFDDLLRRIGLQP